MKILVVSDLHIPTKLPDFPEELVHLLGSYDCVIGLGDYVNLETVMILKKFSKQFYAVHGNMDYPDVKEHLSSILKLNLAGYLIGLCHGWGSPFGLKERILSLFDPKPNIILYGHTHQADCSTLQSVTFINPGSIAESGSYAILELCENSINVLSKNLRNI